MTALGPSFQYRLYVNEPMTGDLVSAAIDVRLNRTAGVQLSWTGTPDGTFSFFGSLDGIDWVDLQVSPAITGGGVPDVAIVNLTDMAFSYLQVRYLRASGSGTLTATVTGKPL